MATDTRQLIATANSDADYQAWAQGIHAQLIACGLVQTADTGQLNLATVAKVTTSNTVIGYEMFRFNDGLQATSPVFIKVEYGSGGASAAGFCNLGLWITVGTGTNGTGTLTGFLSNRDEVATTNTKGGGVTLPSYCSGDGSRIAMCTNYDNATAAFAMVWMVDRTRDGSGNATSDGVVTYRMSQGGLATARVQSLIPGVGWQTAIGNTTGCFHSIRTDTTNPAGGGATVVGNNVAVMPWIVFLGYLRYTLCGLTYKSADISSVAAVVINHLGGSHTYLTLPSLQSSGSNDSMAMIWE